MGGAPAHPPLWLFQFFLLTRPGISVWRIGIEVRVTTALYAVRDMNVKREVALLIASFTRGLNLLDICICGKGCDECLLRNFNATNHLHALLALFLLL